MRILSQINQPHTQYTLNFVAEEKIAANNNSVTNSSNNKKNKHIGSAVTIATFASVGCAFMLSRGVQKNTNKYLNRIKDYLKSKRQQSFIKESDKWTLFYENSIQRINAFIKKSESINNITSLKDILIMRLMYKTKPTKKNTSSYYKLF